MSLHTQEIEIAFEAHLENVAKYERLMSATRSINATCRVPNNDRAGLEMIAQSLDVEVVSTEGLAEMVKSAAKAMQDSFSRVLETLSIWVDKTGRKETARLRRKLEELHGEPAVKQISDRNLADSLSVDGRLVLDHTHTAQELDQLTNAFTDEYIPDITQRDYEIWSLMDKGGLLGWRGKPDNIHSVLVNIIRFLASNKEPNMPLMGQGMDKVIGDRSVFKKAAVVRDMSYAKLSSDSEAQTLIKRYTEDKRYVNGRRAARKGTGVARVGVVPVLSVSELSSAVDAMTQICDTIERTVAIRKQTRGELRQLSYVRVLVGSFNTSEILNVVETDGTTSQREVFKLDEADRQRTDLIVRYVSRDIYDSIKIIMVLSDLQIGAWGAIRDHVGESLNSYRSP